MFRKFVLAAALAAGGFAVAPTAASAGGVSIGIGVGPVYGGYAPIYHRGHRHGYYRYGYYGPRPYRWGHYRPVRPACRTVITRYWNGYRYVKRVRENCGRRYYRY